MKWLGRVSNLRWKVVTLLVAPITFVMTLDRAASRHQIPRLCQCGFSLRLCLVP
jgi:hypothetical protein